MAQQRDVVLLGEDQRNGAMAQQRDLTIAAKNPASAAFFWMDGRRH
jgi:hypothetical protein